MILTIEKLYDLKHEAETAVLAMGYKVPNYKWKLDTRCTSRAGQCRYSKREIGISPKVMQYHPEEKALNTAVHELFHAVAKEQFNDHGHTGAWKRLATEYNRKYPNRMPIKRCYEATDEQRQATQASVKYQVKCNSCGHVWDYQKNSKFVQSARRDGAQRYTCGCGNKGNFELL